MNPSLFFKSILRLLIVLLPLGSLASQDSEWTESKRKNGIVVVTRAVAGSDIPEFLGKTEVTATISEVVSLLITPASCQNLYHQCKELKFLSGTEKKSTIYLKNGAPWPVNDRDVYIERTLDQNAKSLLVTMKIKSFESSSPPPSGVTRMEKFDGVWRIFPLEGGKLKVEYQAHFEPGGTVPKSLINLALTDTPYETLFNLRKLIEGGSQKEKKIDWIKD